MLYVILGVLVVAFLGFVINTIRCMRQQRVDDDLHEALEDDNERGGGNA